MSCVVRWHRKKWKIVTYCSLNNSNSASSKNLFMQFQFLHFMSNMNLICITIAVLSAKSSFSMPSPKWHDFHLHVCTMCQCAAGNCMAVDMWNIKTMIALRLTVIVTVRPIEESEMLRESKQLNFLDCKIFQLISTFNARDTLSDLVASLSKLEFATR